MPYWPIRITRNLGGLPRVEMLIEFEIQPHSARTSRLRNFNFRVDRFMRRPRLICLIHDLPWRFDDLPWQFGDLMVW
jgi:hypothetical protein